MDTECEQALRRVLATQPPDTHGFQGVMQTRPLPTGTAARLLGRWQQSGFHFGHFGFQCFKAGTGARQYHHLAVELFTTDQIQLAEAALQQGFELAFDLIARQGGVAIEQTSSLATQGIEKIFGREHGIGP